VAEDVGGEALLNVLLLERLSASWRAPTRAALDSTEIDFGRRDGHAP
jgi:hypothetical protein